MAVFATGRDEDNVCVLPKSLSLEFGESAEIKRCITRAWLLIRLPGCIIACPVIGELVEKCLQRNTTSPIRSITRDSAEFGAERRRVRRVRLSTLLPRLGKNRLPAVEREMRDGDWEIPRDNGAPERPVPDQLSPSFKLKQ